MKSTRILQSFLFASFCAALLCGQGAAAKRQPEPPKAVPNAVVNPVPLPEPNPVARVVQYGERDVVKLKAKLRFSTIIVLPKNEKILDFTCGDKEFWVVNGSENMAYIKPAKAGAQTDLNLITASGNIYSFVLAEVSELPEGTPGAAPDFKVFVEPKDESMLSAASSSPRFVSAQSLDEYRHQVDLAHEETRQAKDAAQGEIDKGISHFL
jgi:hypothetical protein